MLLAKQATNFEQTSSMECETTNKDFLPAMGQWWPFSCEKQMTWESSGLADPCCFHLHQRVRGREGERELRENLSGLDQLRSWMKSWTSMAWAPCPCTGCTAWDLHTVQLNPSCLMTSARSHRRLQSMSSVSMAVWKSQPFTTITTRNCCVKQKEKSCKLNMATLVAS